MHNVNPKRKNLFESSDYINSMLQTEETRVAWPLVRRMFRDSVFTKNIDTLCDNIMKSHRM